MMREILPAVLSAAKHWGLPAALLQAIVDQEGGAVGIYKAVKCSFPAGWVPKPGTTYLPDALEHEKLAWALDITCRTIVHRMAAYMLLEDTARDFIYALAATWAPPGAANDPTHLNEDWPKGVYAIYHQLLTQEAKHAVSSPGT